MKIGHLVKPSGRSQPDFVSHPRNFRRYNFPNTFRHTLLKELSRSLQQLRCFGCKLALGHAGLLQQPEGQRGKMDAQENQISKERFTKTRRARRFLPWLCIVISSAPFLLIAGSQIYKVTDLGILARPEMGLNNHGLVCGTTTDYQAFVWSNGIITKLGAPANGTSFGRGINDSGQVTGTSYDPLGAPPRPRAVLFSAGSTIDLGTLPGASDCNPFSLNNAGQVVGYTTIGGVYGTLWAGGQVTKLGLNARDINNYGMIVGEATNGACVLDPQTGQHPLPGFSANTASIANAINDQGVIVGYCEPTNYICTVHAVAWINGAITDLGVLATPANFVCSQAYDVNALGKIVGVSDSPTGSHAFIYDAQNGMRDLNLLIDSSSGWVLQSAMAINDSDQVIGNGSYGGTTHAFLLTPIPQLAPAIARTTIALSAGRLATGTTYTIQQSSDLVVWRDACTFVAPCVQTNWSDCRSSTNQAIFYRLKF